MRRAGIDPRLLEAEVKLIAPGPRQQLGVWLGQGERRLEAGQGLYLWGPVGTGKSMAAVAVVRALAEFTESLKWWATSDLMLALENPYQRAELMAQTKGVRVLVLDDFGAQVLSPKYAEWLDQIADGRYRRRRTTVVTSNVAPQLLGAGMERLMDRWRHSMVEVEFAGSSRRAHEEAE